MIHGGWHGRGAFMDNVGSQLEGNGMVAQEGNDEPRYVAGRGWEMPGVGSSR